MSDLWRLVFDDERFNDMDMHHFSWGSAYKPEPAEIRAAAESAGFLVVDREEAEVVMWCSAHKCVYNDGAPGCDVWIAAREGGALHPKPCVVNQFSECYVVPVDVEEAE